MFFGVESVDTVGRCTTFIYWQASVFVMPCFLCMQIIAFSKRLQLLVLLTLAQMITFFFCCTEVMLTKSSVLGV
jgi:hypothetical protein